VSTSKCLGCGENVHQLSLLSKEIHVSRDALVLAKGNIGRGLADTWGENQSGEIRLCHRCSQMYDTFLATILALEIDKKEFKVSDIAGPIYPHFDSKDTAFRMVVWAGGTSISYEVRTDST